MYVVGEGPADAMIVAPALTGVWTLVVEKSPCLPAEATYAFPLGARALAGRDPDMDIYLDDTFVSSKHALFEITPSGLQGEDLRLFHSGPDGAYGSFNRVNAALIHDSVRNGRLVYLIEDLGFALGADYQRTITRMDNSRRITQSTIRNAIASQVESFKCGFRDGV